MFHLPFSKTFSFQLFHFIVSFSTVLSLLFLYIGGVESHIFKEGSDALVKASFFERCASNGKLCKSGLVCSSKYGKKEGRCECAVGTVYAPNEDSCLRIPTRGSRGVCLYDIQCQTGSWGSLSKCNDHTAQCECYDMPLGRRNVTLVDGVCYVEKSIGDPCTVNDECNETIKGSAYCKGGRCHCRETHVYSDSLGRCVIKKRYNESCEYGDECRYGLGLDTDCIKSVCLPLAKQFRDECTTGEQCQRGSLGKLSTCIDGQCQCHAERNGSREPTSYHPRKHRCFLRKWYNDSCNDNDECEASLGPAVICGYRHGVDASISGRVCYCPTGKVCRSTDRTFAVGLAITNKNDIVSILILAFLVFHDWNF